ncbi:DUF6850 family outer membrane beta-barrel protein [Epilithonimonas sp.]|uniref:DUF6850 family outer membrane beta-barrel protein n=1 Tax=Epilithonimonas sp. TaxID=2894511 RepID=UPI0028984FB6|nr:DUF6850 family outer membrane beta-barrel protein [Epilithonimonas sp.]
MNQSKFFIVLSFCIGLISISGQDSLRLFPTISNQYNEERIQTNNFYYNPANMSDYSSFSMSEFSVNYQSDDQKTYLRQIGSGDTGFSIKTNSFKKLKSNSVVWGNAGYSNMTRKNIRYNENLDFERIAPYVTLDSVGGNINLETYHFAGGYAKKMNRFSFGLSGSYEAQMAYRSRDPRSRDTTSDLLLSAGINYRVYRDYQVGIFGEFNKYTQNSKVAFVNEVSFPIVYQSIGFGYTNYFFNNTVETQFEELGYKIGGQISSKNGKDFYIIGTLSNSNNIKGIHPRVGNRYYDTSDLENKTSQIEAAKFITLKNNRIGLIFNYNSTVRTGTEYGYTSNSDNTELIFKRKAYKKEQYTTSIKGLYQLSQEKYTFTAIPFFSYQEVIDRRIYPFSGQKYDAYTFGLDLDLKVEIKKNQVLTFRPNYAYRSVNKAINALDTNVSSGKLEWILEDFDILTSDSFTMGVLVRYDFKIQKLPAFFVSGQRITKTIKEKNNNFAVLSLGIIF